VAAITVHCRTARMGHSGEADWSWARRVREVVGVPVMVNGDVRSADDARRALDETGCAGAMVGRRAIEHPWIFREARALLDRGVHLDGPSPAERVALCRAHLLANVEARGEWAGVRVTRRHLAGYLCGLRGAAALRRALNECGTLAGCLEILDGATCLLAA
jgi:tRNA-dihydrouridine synthase